MTEPSDAQSSEKKPGMLALLRQRQFRTLWLAQTVSWSGDHFTFLALMIVINQVTGSAAAIAGMMLVMTVPRLLFGLAAGVLVDRWNRKWIMVTADALRGLLSLALIWVATAEHLWLLYPLAFVISSLGVFFMPARGAVMKTILKPDELLPGNILMQMTYTFTVVLGPALAGVTIGVFGAAPAFAFDALTFLASSALVASMAIAHVARRGQAAAQGSFLAELKEGLATVAASRTVSGLLLVLTVVSLATGAVNALFVPFMMNVMRVGPTQLGLADSAQGLGMILGGALAAAVATRIAPNVSISGTLILASLSIIGIALSPSYVVVLLLLGLLGLVVTPINAVIPALMQKVVPLERMGRVGGAMNTSQSVATLVSMGAAGALADVVGTQVIFVAAGLIGIAGGIVAIAAIRDEEPTVAQPGPLAVQGEGEAAGK